MRRRADGRAGRPGRLGRPGLVMWLGLALLAPAAGALAEPGDPVAWWVAPQLKRLTHSHTSYEFGDPSQRELSPLSRLEYPLNSWWGGVGLGLKGPRYALELTVLTSLPGQDDVGVLRDSDWEDPTHSKIKTCYSETTTKLKNSLDVNGKVSLGVGDWLGLPAWLDLRPLMGARWQHFVFVARDGVQQNLDYDPDSPTYGQWRFVSLPGEGLWFRQDYLNIYLGLAATVDLGHLGLGRPGQGWELSLQGDLGHVFGENRDRHLLRGDRWTSERTQGHALHGSLSLRAPFFGWGSLVLTGEHLVIETRGDHYWQETGDSPVENWDYGVRVWSRQTSLSLSLEIPF